MRLLLIALGSVALFFPTYWLFHAAVGPNWGAAIAAVAMYVAFPALGMALWTGPRRRPDPLGDALESGNLAIDDHAVFGAVEVAETEDEGLHFFLDIGDGRTLHLSGQYLYEPVRRALFPRAHVRVLWNRSNDVTYGVLGDGEPCEILERLGPYTPEHGVGGHVPADRAVLAQPLSTVVAKLRDVTCPTPRVP